MKPKKKWKVVDRYTGQIWFTKIVEAYTKSEARSLFKPEFSKNQRLSDGLMVVEVK